MANLVGNGVRVFECPCLIGEITFYHAYDFLGVDLHIWCTDAVAHLDDWNGLAQRWVEWLIHVVQMLGFGTVETVQLKDDLLGHACHCGGDAAGSCQIGLASALAFFDVAHFEDGPVDFAHKTIAQFLCHLAQVDVVVGDFAQVDALAELRVGGVGRTVFDGTLFSQHAVGALASRGTGEDAYLEFSSCLVFCFSYLCKFPGYCLCSTCRCKTAKSKVLSVFYHCGGFCCRDTCISHNMKL